jgi:hypothetical protein
MSPPTPLLTQTPSAPVTPMDDLRRDLDGRIDNLTQQMEAFMTSFREATPSSISAPALPPSTTTVNSPVVTSSPALLLPSPLALPVDPLCSPIVPSGVLLRPTLEPTPELQGPPPPVARSNAELIGDSPGDHPVDPVRLAYTPQGHSHRRRTARTNEAFEFKSHAKSSDDARRLHSSQRRDALFVSGYYWASPSPVLASIVWHGSIPI